jgi:hypothetical protein
MAIPHLHVDNGEEEDTVPLAPQTRAFGIVSLPIAYALLDGARKHSALLATTAVLTSPSPLSPLPSPPLISLYKIK